MLRASLTILSSVGQSKNMVIIVLNLLSKALSVLPCYNGSDNCPDCFTWSHWYKI